MTLKSEQHYPQSAMGHLLVMDWACTVHTHLGLYHYFIPKEKIHRFFIYLIFFLRGGGVGMKDRER